MSHPIAALHPLRLAAVAAVAATVVAAIGVSGRGRTSAAAAEVRPSPGQLALLDNAGKPAGLCPLKHTDVTADIAGYVARVTVKQEFGNPSSQPVEAIYTFPLPDDAAVDDMTMTIGSRVVRGEIKRREEAREIYEAAKAAGQTASLLDQERPNIFTQSVANIMPGDRIVITISYVHLLKYQEGQYTFTFPMVVGPRFVQGGGGYTTPGKRGDPSPQQTAPEDPGATPTITDADRITPPITPPGTRSGHDVSLTVNLDAGLPLQQVASTLHAVDIQRRGPTRATIRLRNQAEIPNRDFILKYTAAGSQMQEGVLTYAPGTSSGSTSDGGYFTLILQPPAAPPQAQVSAKEMVFVIDQTGSQQGWPIAKAKETMKYAIQNLNPDDTFQLIGFNTQVYPCFSAPVHNTPQNVAKALKFLEPIEGNGGTDILKSVDYALNIPDDPSRLRIVCYMTDGYVGNDMQIVDYVGKHRGRARMFPFGCGNSVNRFLIDGMAREGCGEAEYVTLKSDAKEAAARFYRRIASPYLLDVSVDWGGLPVEDVYPKHIPDVFSAGPVMLKGRYAHAGEGDVTIHGVLRGQPWQRTVHVVLPPTDREGSAIAALWARERIEDLQNQDWIGAQTGQPKQDIKDQIVATALEYRLMSQYTSFVAVEQQVVNVGGKQRTVDVPVEMPEGVSYEGIFGDRDESAIVAGGRMVLRRTRGISNYALSAGASLGYGGGVAGKPAAAAPVPALKDMEQLATNGLANKEVLDGTAAGEKKLAAMKPEERRVLLERTKLATALQQELAAYRKPKIENRKSKILTVSLWLNALPPDGLAKLKALGFTLDATLRPGKVLLGTIAVEKLDDLIALPFVRRVEQARLH